MLAAREAVDPGGAIGIVATRSVFVVCTIRDRESAELHCECGGLAIKVNVNKAQVEIEALRDLSWIRCESQGRIAGRLSFAALACERRKGLYI